MPMTDRGRDDIDSGGKRLASMDIENFAMAQPAVAMAACIAALHTRRDEHPCCGRW